MKRAVIYTRVSRDDSGEGRSNERQEEQCRKLADLRGWEVVHIEEDISISAFSGKDRPGWNRVLEMVEAGTIDVVVAWHVDRMTRSMLDLEHLILLAEKHGVGIATVSGDIDLTTDVGRMVARILAAVARAEVERKSARQKLANAQRANEGVPASGGVRPFGYEQDRITVIPKEAEAIRGAAQKVLAGVSLSSIAREWTELGLVSSRAHKSKAGWSARGVQNVLLNPRYAGARMYLGVEVSEGQWEAILDRETHLALAAVLKDPARRLTEKATGRTPGNLLTSIAQCGECGRTVRATRVRDLLVYKCSSNSHGTVPREDADEWVRAYMIRTLSSEKVLGWIAQSESDTTDAQDRISTLRSRLNGLSTAFSAGLIDIDQLTAGSAPLRAELAAVEQAAIPAESKHLFDGLDLGSGKVEAQWDALPLGRRRVLVERLLFVTMKPRRGRGPLLTIPEHVVIVPTWATDSVAA